jgi:hypothetical protein
MFVNMYSNYITILQFTIAELKSKYLQLIFLLKYSQKNHLFVHEKCLTKTTCDLNAMSIIIPQKPREYHGFRLHVRTKTAILGTK